MTKILVFTSSKNTDQIDKIRKNESGETIVIPLNYMAQKKLQKEFIPFNTLEKYINDKIYEENVKETIKWLKSWPNIKNIDKKSFKEFVVYQNFSLWWPLENALFYGFRLSDITWEIKKIKSAINTENPQKIIIVGNERTYKELVIAIGNLKRIPTFCIESIVIKNMRHFLQFLKPYFWLYIALARDFVRKYLVKIITPIFKFKIEEDESKYKKNKIIILSETPGWQIRLNVKVGKKRKTDVYYDSLIEELLKNKENDILVIHLDWSKPLALKILLEKLLSGLKCTFIESYFSIQAKKGGIFLSDIWGYLKNNEKFKNNLIFDEVPIWNLMKNTFHFFFTYRFIRIIQQIEGAKKMIKIENPSIIVMTDDFLHVFQLVGKMENVPTLAIQHGVIGHPTINFKNVEGGSINAIHPLWRPITDKIAVFGDYYKDFFINYGSYPPDKVVVTGQPKNDYLARADEIFDKNKLCNELGINPNEKIIVWITTHGPPLHENKKNILCVYNAIKSLENIELIIKLHPGENQKAPLYKENKLIKPIIIAAKDADTNELLYACDVIITKNSTTAIEAMILNKPVIILNLSNQSDYVPYAESGAAAGVYKEEDLLPILKKVLSDSQFRKKLEKNRKKFVYEHAYIQDGKASKRVADLLTQMIEDAKEGSNEKRI